MLASNALTTIDRLCEYMDIDVPASGSVKYSVLENIINSMSSFVEDYVGYSIKKASYAIELDTESDSESLILPIFPISSTGFYLQVRRDVLNRDDWETIDSTDYFVDYEAGIVESADGLSFQRSKHGFRAIFSAGYDYDNSSTFLSDVGGGSIELALWMLCKTVYSRRKGGTNIKNESIGDYSVTYFSDSIMDDTVKSLLASYVRAGDNSDSPLTPMVF